jgi:predicted permease
VVERETQEEIETHLATRAEELERQGLTPEEAKAEALRRFGSLDLARRRLAEAAQVRERRSAVREWLEALRQDVRYALRSATHERGFTAVVIIMIALGVGANAAMFGIIDRLLLRGPAHVVEPGSLTRIYYSVEVPGLGRFSDNTFGYVTYTTLRDGARGFDGVAAYSENDEGILGEGEGASQVRAGHATSDFFPLLGVQPFLGRFFDATEDQPGAAQQVVVLGYEVWRNRFGGDRDILGQTVPIQGDPHVVVGVMPFGFTGANLTRVDIWMPMSLRQPTSDWQTAWDAQWLKVVARLSPGLAREEAEADATQLYRTVYAGDEEPFQQAQLHAGPLWYDDAGREPMEVAVSRWLIGVSLVVLLVACANVINLLLARALRRRREVSVRLALGVTRARLIRQLLTESMVLALMGGFAALIVVPLVAGLVRGALLANVEWTGSALDLRVLLVAGGLTLVAGVVTGLVPALQAGRGVVSADLRTGMGREGAPASRVRRGLAVAQAAASLVLLVGAGLFLRSLHQANTADLGIEPGQILAVQANWPSSASRSREERRARSKSFYDESLRRVQQMPGVEAVAIAVGTPFFSSFQQRLRVGGRDSIPRLPGGGPYLQAISSDYFQTTGLRLLSGRSFGAGDHEGSDRVTIINETMSRTLWPAGDAIGQCLMIGPEASPPCTQVVGTVEDAHRFSLQEQPAMQYYLPLGQEEGIGGSRLLVRPRGEPRSMIAEVRSGLREVDASVLWLEVETLQNALDPQIRPWKLGATLIGVFGLLALVIAAIGLYSLIAFMVTTRTHELGVRVALGAGRWNVMRLVMQRGIGLAVAGLALGGLVAWLAASRIQDLLFGVSARDPIVYGSAGVVLFLAAVLACLVPGRRATRVDPMKALRAD